MANSPRRGKNDKKSGRGGRSASALPDKAAVLEFIQSSGETSGRKVGKREIARAFNIRGEQRIALKALLRQMADEGLIDGRRKNIGRQGVIPAVAVLSITHLDDDGELIAKPMKWSEEQAPPLVRVQTDNKSRAGASVGVGDRILARIDQAVAGTGEDYPYRARVLKKLPRENRELLGIFRRLEDGSGVIEPVDRKLLREWVVAARESVDATDGELVRFRPNKSSKYGPQSARLLDNLGNPDEQKTISLIAIHRHGIPDSFPKKVLDELDNLPALTLDNRADLRQLPLITIDPSDARDHDDAVHARTDDSDDNRGGFVVTVAIADVAHYVRPHTPLDEEALKRGNSVYFPDRVVPMLPEKISNDLCSLREHQDRPCIAVEMRFNPQGEKIAHKFMRAMMNSHAKLSYEQAQQAIDGRPDETTAPLLESVLEPLWRAWRALMQAREQRQPLELELPERKIIMNDKGHIKDIIIPERLDAHRVIEEFMIQANVSAAQTLEKLKSPLIYRAHAAPSFEKVHALADFLHTLKIKFPRNAKVSARQFNHILAQVVGLDVEQLVNETILRSQSQAEYSIENDGHFGLNLRHYAHFTSPIRRYADLVVHRALIKALHLGDGGLPGEQAKNLENIASDISNLERRAMAAERETVDRLIAFHLSSQVGATFEGRISGVTRSGLFVRLNDTGADGFIPISTIGREYFIYNEEQQALIGEQSGETHRMGAPVSVRLVEAIPTAGALRFELLTKGTASRPPASRRNKPPHKGKGKSKGGAPKHRGKRR